jgi:hypothetical protein
MGYNLVLTGHKPTLVRGGFEGLLSREGTPLCRGNQLRNHLINLWRPEASGRWKLLLCQRRKESNLPGSSQTWNPAESISLVVSWLGMGWHVVGSYSTTRPKVGRKGILSQLVGFGNLLTR